MPTLPFHLWIRYLLRISWGTAGLMSLVINIAVAATLLILSNQRDSRWNEPRPPVQVLIEQHLNSDNAPVYVAALLVLANLSIALVVKLYRAAILGKTTPEEQTPGIVGIKAWLSPLNVITVICVAVSAYVSLDYDYIGVSIAGLCVLLAYPLVNTMMQQSSTPSMAAASLDLTSPLKAPANERQRVLALVESGKITAEDGAELLTALAQSLVAGNGAAGSITGPRRVMLVGAAIVLVGFFLPWFTINLSQAMHDAMTSVQQIMPQIPGGVSPNITFNTSPGFGGNANPVPFNPAPGEQVPVNNAMQISVRGGDVQHGLGWMVLSAALLSAALPFFWTPNKAKLHHLRNAILATLAVGSVLAVYLLSGSLNSAVWIEPGFFLALAGYVVLWIGSVREYVSFPARLEPAIAAI